jgi:hypothetical protein
VKITQGTVTNTIRLNDYYRGRTDLIPNAWTGGESIFPQLTMEAATNQIGSGFVRILGKVKQPGEYRFEQTKDIYDYLIQAGGPVDQANLEEVVLIRSSHAGKEAIQFSMKEPSSFPIVQAGDVIMLEPEAPSKMEKDSRVWGAFSGVISALAGVAAIVGLAF